MNKKILFLIILSVILFFVPMVKINATQVYIGVQITATTPEDSSGNASPGTLWCLPIGTEMGLMDSAGSSYLSPVGATQNPVTTTAITCPGGTIWSGLLDLTNGSSYDIRITPPNYHEFCSGWQGHSWNCYETWDAAGENKNCNAVCAHYGQTPDSGDGGVTCHSYNDSGCQDLAAIKGSPCTTCTSTSNYSYYTKNANGTSDCYSAQDNYSPCSWSDPTVVRVCICKEAYYLGWANFDYPFVPTGL